MIMETISCGYPMTPTGLVGAPLSSQDAETYAPQLYSQNQYTEPDFGPTQLHHSYSKYEDDANNNNHIYNTSDAFNNNSRSTSTSSSSSEHESLLGDLSSMSITESDERYSDLSTVSESPDYLSQMSPPSPTSLSSRPKSKKNSRSKSKSSSTMSEGEAEKTRKDSFVYDVRLPDEQILLFVPDLDLVKSHLMFAVREEVDVLKDRIVELMDRIKHLECENTILRQYASPEVLQQIQSQLPHQLQQPPHHSSTS